jgi:hypothetical protein
MHLSLDICKLTLLNIHIMTKSTIKGLLFLCIFWSSCSKNKNEPSKSDCEVNKYGTITVSNNSSNPYNLYIDNTFKMQIAGKAITEKIRIDQGNSRKLYAKQVSGYILYPTEKTENFNVISCSDYSWQIP